MRSLISLGLTLGYSAKLSPAKSPHFKSLQTQIIEIIAVKKNNKNPTTSVRVLIFHLVEFEQGDFTCNMGGRYL